MNTKEIIGRIFKDPSTKYELTETEFEDLVKPKMLVRLKSAISVWSFQGNKRYGGLLMHGDKKCSSSNISKPKDFKARVCHLIGNQMVGG